MRLEADLKIENMAPRPQNIDAGARLLALAFKHDPWIQHLMGPNEGEHYLFFKFIIELAFFTGQEVLCLTAPELAGLAIVDTNHDTNHDHDPDPHTQAPRPKGKGSSFNGLRGHLGLIGLIVSFLGWMGLKRFITLNRYMALASKQRRLHAGKSAYLVCLGVDPSCKGRGYGRTLVEAAHQRAKERGQHKIGLDTELKENITLYEHLGYSLVGESHLDEVCIYSMVKDL